jgi:hypothetical protein
VTNAHRKPALGDTTNAVVKKETAPDKTNVAITRPLSRKISTFANTTKLADTKTAGASRQTASVVIPKKRPSEAVASAPAPPRRTLSQSLSSTSLASKGRAHAPARRHAEEPVEAEAPRKKQKVEKKQDWDDLDAADANDPQMVSEYVNEIFDYLRKLEVLVSYLSTATNCRSSRCLIHRI